MSLDICQHPPYHWHSHNGHIPHFPEFPRVALFCFFVGRILNMRSALLTNLKVYKLLTIGIISYGRALELTHGA